MSFLFIGAYAAAFLWEQGENGTVTQTAEYAQVGDSFSVKGTVFRPLVPIVCDGGEYLILAAEGEYLSGGSAVAVKAENAGEYFAFRDYEISAESFSSEEDAVNAIRSDDASRRALAAVYLEGRKPPKECAEPEGVIYAPCAGIYTGEGGGIGSVADGFNWYFSFESDKVPELKRGQKLYLEISSLPQLEAEVFSIDSAEKTASAIIRGSPGLMPPQGEETAAVSLPEHRGLRVPKAAVHYDENGTAFVNVLSAGAKEKKPVGILYTARDYYLCSDGALREDMEIIVSEKRKQDKK